MKILFQFLIIIFVIHFGFGQNNISNNNQLLAKNIISKFPKTISNQSDFDLALTQIPKIEKILEIYTLQNLELAKLIIPAKNYILWSEKNSTLKNQLICKYFYLFLNVKIVNPKEIIETGLDLLKFKENLTKTEINNILGCLVIGYRKIEAYNEIIKITPLRKKYVIPEFIKITDIENDLALAYYNTKNYVLAAKSFLKVKEEYKIEKNFLMVSSMSNNVGLCYLKLYDNVNAQKYFDIAIRELSQTKGIENKERAKGYNVFFKSVIQSNIAVIDIDNKNFDKAIRSYIDLKKKAIIVGETEVYNVTDAYLNISKIYLRKNNPNMAKSYLDSTKTSLGKIVSSNLKIEINNQEAKILLLNGDPQKATLFFNASKKITDSITQIQIGRENILAQAKYNSDEKDKELLVTKIDLKSKEKISTFQKIGLIIAIFLLTTIVLLYFKSLKDKNIIKTQKDNLLISLSEKEVLLKELHHRVKNNLQVIVGLLQLQSKKVKSQEMTELLNDSQRHINSMALVHEMLYQQNDFEVVPMNNYLTELSKQISQSFFDKKIQVFVSANNINLSINKAVPLGLMISELMTNSNKYAFEEKIGTITIELNKNLENNLEFIYQDSGKGLPENFKEKMPKTMGLRLLNMLAEEMHGILKFDNKNGFKAKLEFGQNEKI